MSMLEGEKVRFDAYHGFMVSTVCVKANLAFFDDVKPIMAINVKYQK